MTPRAHWLFAIAVLLSWPANALPCSAGVSPQTTRRVFAAALKVATGPGYKFEGVSTDQANMELRWSRNGQACPAIRVTVLDCAHAAENQGKLGVTAPPELASQCPELTSVPNLIAGLLQTEHASGGKPLPAPLSLLHGVTIGILLLALLAMGLIGKKSSDGDIGRGVFIVGGAIIVALSIVEQFLIPVRRELLGGDIERLYRAVAWSPWEQLASPGDYHHPGLWFAIVHGPFEWTHHALVTPAVLDRGCLIAAVVLGGLCVREWAGRLPALVAMAGLALLPLLAEQSREVSDVTLFVALALAVVLVWVRLCRAPTIGKAVLFALIFGASFHASYAAIPLAGALLIDLALHRSKWLAGAFAGGVLLGMPRLVHVIQLVPMELLLRRQTAHSSVPQWSSVGFGSFLHRTMEVDFSRACWLLLPVLLLVILSGHRLWRERSIGLLGIGAYTAFLLMQPLMRIRDYYALLLPVLVIVVVASFAAPGGARRRVLALASGCALVAVFACETLYLWPLWGLQEGHPDRTLPVIEAARKDGARTLVYDSDWQHTTWNFFDDPYGSMTARLRGTGPMTSAEEIRDPASDRRVVGLGGRDLSTDWQGHTVTRLQAMQRDGDVHLFLDSGIPNPGLFSYVADRCQRLAKDEMYELWRCPRQ